MRCGVQFVFWQILPRAVVLQRVKTKIRMTLGDIKWFEEGHFYYCGYKKAHKYQHSKTSNIFISSLSKTSKSNLPPHAVSIYIQLYFSLITITPTQLSHKFTDDHHNWGKIRNIFGARSHRRRKCNLIARLSWGPNEVANAIQSHWMFYFPPTSSLRRHTQLPAAPACVCTRPAIMQNPFLSHQNV